MIADYIFDDEKQLHAELIQIDVDGKKARLRRKSAKLLNKISNSLYLVRAFSGSS